MFGKIEADFSKHWKINGRCDLTDFFPVWLDISSVLASCPPSNGITYKLHCPTNALRFIYTDLANTNAGDYLTKDIGLSEAETTLIPETGITLNADFLNRIAANTNKGVLLIEAADVPSRPQLLTAPLLLTVASNDTILAYTELPICLSGVEYMFRHKNLRAEIGVRTVIGTEMQEGVDDRPAAPNEPDPDSTANLFFLHGFGVNERSARGWNAEMFKRLYWSGSKARFHGITWYGDKGGPANYQENVNHAFKTAPYLKDYVSSVSGTKIMLAHSLGNMVVSSAIQDYDMSVQKYLMLDAAVASEAYDASLFNESANNNPMLHADWRGYNPQTWSANFHKLYSLPDTRAKLTWKNRFSSVVSKAYNFYNSEDEVFEINPKSVGTMTGVEFDFDIWLPDTEVYGLEHYSWQKNEVFKGRNSFWLPGSLGTTKWWGWGFHNSLWATPDRANALSTAELKKYPVFRHNPDMYVYEAELGTNEVNQLLAMGLPAMSPSAGQTNIAAILPAKNINISTLKENGWPRNHPVYGDRWLHSDCKDAAFLYTYKLFDELATEGGLK